VSWQPTPDSGGAPLTRYALRVNRERRWLPPDATSVVLRGVVPGAHRVRVRAANAVAGSQWAPTAVEVPAYPSVSGPHRARKGKTITLALRGLLPGARAVVTVDPVKGRTLTKRPMVRRDGTATVRFTVRRRLTVVVASGGVASRPHRVGLG
jgi:hypothetical protein